MQNIHISSCFIITLGLALAACASQPPSTHPSDATRGIVMPNGRLATLGLEEGAQLYARSYAVVIGVDDYTQSPRLDGAARDARAIAEVLGTHDTEVQLILNGEATRERLVRLLRDELPARLGPQDRVVIFFAGHGATWEERGVSQGMLVPVEGALAGEALRASGISMEELQGWLAHYPAKHVIFIADACYSGLAIASRGAKLLPTVPAYLKKVVDLPVRLTLVAGARDEQAMEWRGHGLFTWFLLDALRGAADVNQDGLITSDEIVAYVKPNVARVAYEERRHAQNPQAGRSGEGEVIFFNPRGEAKALCPAGTYRSEGGACATWESSTCPPNFRAEGGTCVRSPNQVCFNHGFFDPKRGCRPSPLLAAQRQQAATQALRNNLQLPQTKPVRDTVEAQLIRGAYQGVIGRFTTPPTPGGDLPGERGLAALRDALQQNPDPTPQRAALLYNLAMLSWDRALRYHEQANLHCASDTTCISQALARYTELHDETLALFQEAEDLHSTAQRPTPPELIYHHALALLQAGSIGEAQQRLRQLKAPGALQPALVRHTQGEVAFLQQDLPAAAEHYRIALQDPELPTALYTSYKRGLTLLNLGEPEQARQILNEAEALTRKSTGDVDFHTSILNELVIFFAQDSTPQRAMDYFPQRAQSRERLRTILERLGFTYWELGKLSEARMVWEQLLQDTADPEQQLRLLLALAQLDASQGHPQAMLASLQRALDLLIPHRDDVSPDLQATFSDFLRAAHQEAQRNAARTRHPAQESLARDLDAQLQKLHAR